MFRVCRHLGIPNPLFNLASAKWRHAGSSHLTSLLHTAICVTRRVIIRGRDPREPLKELKPPRNRRVTTRARAQKFSKGPDRLNLHEFRIKFEPPGPRYHTLPSRTVDEPKLLLKNTNFSPETEILANTAGI